MSDEHFLDTPFDHVPDFGSGAATGREVATSPGNTWAALFGNDNAERIVQITQPVVIDADAVAHTVAILPGGSLHFARDADVTLRAVNVLVHEGGWLDVGTEADPIAGSATLLIRDVPLDLAFDVGQYGNGLLVAGKYTACGRAKTPWATAAVARAGDSVLTLSAPPLDWQQGDRLVLAAYRQVTEREQLDAYQHQDELAEVAGVDGNVVTLAAPLKYDYFAEVAGETLLPYVGNLTRNVAVASENPAGVRGHTIYFHRAEVNVRFAEYRGLGRTTIDPLAAATNRIGRYALHLHHVYGPVAASGPQFEVVGCSLWEPLSPTKTRWGIAVHDSHYGLISDNVTYGFAGSHIVTEDGSETGNEFRGNLSIRASGRQRQDTFSSQDQDPNGNNGNGIWCKGVNNHYVGNVAINCRWFGLSLGDRTNPDMLRVPKFPGADMHDDAQVSIVPSNGQTALTFADNVAVGCLIGANLNIVGKPATVARQASWLSAREGVGVYFGHGSGGKHQIVDAHLRGGFIGVLFNRYSFGDVLGGSIEGFAVGISHTTGKPVTVTGTRLVNDVDVQVNYFEPTIPLRSGVPVVDVLTDVDFGGDEHIRLTIARQVQEQQAFTRDVRVQVEGYGGESFRVYFPEQAADWVIPPWAAKMPARGITNAELFEQYGVAVAGSVAPAGAGTRAKITGLVEE